MLFKARKYTHEKLGTFVLKSGVWVGESLQLNFYLEGDRNSPSQIALEQLLNIREKNELFEVALRYLRASEVEGLDCETTNIELESVWLYSELGKFDVSFGHKIEDWEFIVHFIKNAPNDVSVVH